MIPGKIILVVGILFNIGLLGYFKYANFFISNLNWLLNKNFSLMEIVLPVAISFFTFKQISYLFDCYRNEITADKNFLDYCLFVSFFPQLIAGPIVRHSEMMPQFNDKKARNVNWDNIASALVIFCIGLFKKIGIADSLAVWANTGFSNSSTLSFSESWATSLSFTFQLYYDFSGYTDMAIGSALMLNIRLPANFNSPYKALNMRDFWRRWHITLSTWLRDYLYIPLGGNRKGRLRTYFNIFITFLICGLWHGAGWTFLIWGILHGIGLIIHRIWQMSKIKLPVIVAWFITFIFVNFTMVFFKASDIKEALNIIKSMIGMKTFNLHVHINKILGLMRMGVLNIDALFESESLTIIGAYIFIIICGLVAFLGKNSIEIVDNIKAYKKYTVFLCSLMLLISILLTIKSVASEFIYFNF